MNDYYQTPGWLLRDLDGDGIPELLLGANWDEGHTVISTSTALAVREPSAWSTVGTVTAGISAPMAVWQTKAAAAHLKAATLTTAIPAASYSIWKRCCIWMTVPALTMALLRHNGSVCQQW